MTPTVERIIAASETNCRAGSSAMHSTTTAWASNRSARLTTLICSRMFAGDLRRIVSSLPSGRISLGRVPVVLARVRMPDRRSAAAIRRVTFDFPRVPFTWIRMGMRSSLRS